MKVRSFFAGLADGVEGAFAILDREVASELGDVKIHQLTDTFYPKVDLGDRNKYDPRIVRVVIYN